jgi:hypothetical protein
VPDNHNGNVASPSVSPTPVVSSRLRRFLSNVSAGDRDKEPLPALTDNEWHDIQEGTRVRTDENGEGWLKLKDCMLVYVFQTSQMVTAPCSKAELASGHVNCQLAGTSVYNNSCEGLAKQMIQTPSAEIEPEGTWFSVTYLPEQQLTLTIVLKGRVTVRPITDPATHSLGEPAQVNAGQMWYTMPDDKLNAARDNAGGERQVKTLAESQSIANSLLGIWADRILERAKQDEVPFPESPPASPSSTATPKTAVEIDCDCGNLKSGRLIEQLQARCRQVEANLKSQYQESGKVIGFCDPRVSGPNAKPKQFNPP